MSKEVVKISILGFLILAVLGGIFFLAFSIKKRSAEIKTLQAQISKQSQIIKKITLLNSELKKFNDYQIDLDSLLPKKYELINFDDELKKMARFAAVDVVLGSLEEGRVLKDNILYSGFTLSIEGTMENIIEFLKILENSRYPIKFISFDLRLVGSKLRGVFGGRVFYLNNE